MAMRESPVSAGPVYALSNTSTVKPGTRFSGGGGGGKGGGDGAAGGTLGGIDDVAYENIDGGTVGVVEVMVPFGADICAQHEQGER